MSKSDSSKEPDEDISEIVFDERVFGFSQEIQIVAYATFSSLSFSGLR